jgi:sugar/nucleoside kinase (ribokinase family)
MKYVVLGHPCLDEIVPAKGQPASSWGGIFYALAAMQHCARVDDRVVPVFPVGSAEAGALKTKLRGYTHLDLEGIYSVEQPTFRVRLEYDSPTTRREISRNMLPPIDFETLRPHLAGAHFLLLNMVSGRDLTLDQLRQIRIATRRPHVFIYMDVHSLVLDDPPAQGPRKFRTVANWNDWLMNVDGLQLNEEELVYFGGDERTLCDSAMSFRNVQMINVTRADRGVSVYARDAKGEPVNEVFSRIDVPPVTLGTMADCTGCGDVFGAAFLTYYAYTRHSILAAQFGAFVAAANGLTAGAAGVDRLREYVAHYPVFP